MLMWGVSKHISSLVNVAEVPSSISPVSVCTDGVDLPFTSKSFIHLA